ncbi:putative mitochondrial 2-oxoglutarate/malate carrier protein [Symbiodinium microadriaticum]|uniref:Putative mitochondrial 2-oxoglutarate/malate carrier protein n=1 Tax=Symbiodinium microadriaticum TaxID=2951 RepID=A0A1Q9DX20_SYMMI|nr:putative mitochondrial 2-oxoglutarate/malate carrier protein [Symbiodinium microadriaticum]
MAPEPHRAWHRFVAGGLGEMFAVSFSHPADVLKVRLQLTGECDRAMRTLRLRDMRQVAHKLVVQEGFQGLYAGISAAWLRQAVFGTLRHGLYGVFERWGKADAGPIPLLWRLQAALGAGVVLIRMQSDAAWPAHQRRSYGHALHGLVRVWREEGWQALYRGVGPTTARAALVTMSQLATYEEVKSRALAAGAVESVRLHLGCAMASATVACLATQPVDCVKTRPVDVIRKTVATEGILAFYKGLSATFLRLWPHTVLLWLGQESVTSRLRSLEL